MLNKETTDKILRAFYIVFNELGYGFAEKVYENALMFEMQKMGLQCDNQMPIKVFYKQMQVGVYYADLVVDNKVILKIKACGNLIDEHEAQLLNYLKATEIETGLLLNFGKEPQFRRKVFSNSNKNNPRLSA